MGTRSILKGIATITLVLTLAATTVAGYVINKRLTEDVANLEQVIGSCFRRNEIILINGKPYQCIIEQLGAV